MDSESKSEYYQQRLHNVAADGKECGYPNDFQPTVSVMDFRDTWSYLSNDETDEAMEIQMTGRVDNKRIGSKSLIFLDIVAERGRHFQILLTKRNYTSDTVYGALVWSAIRTTINRGDIIGVVGYPHRTKRGELSVRAHGIRLLVPCLHEIPRDLEDRRLVDSQRYLSYIIHKDSMMPILMRSRFIHVIREFLDNKGFLEVETSILQSGTGANAEPFKTHYRSLGTDVNLRVAPELCLKRAVISGYGPVYEIGKQFRNEGMDPTHNPEFTTCEFYWPYQTIRDLFQVTESLFHRLSEAAGEHLVEGINWTEPFHIIDIVPELERQCKMTFTPPYDTDALRAAIRDKGLDIPVPCTVSKMFDVLISELIESQCHHPTFLYGHPLVMSPLAKPEAQRPHIAARFELFAKGKELCNAYSELNNPVLQRENFRDQLKAQQSGDKETINDESYCLALEYGLPPTAGWGMGIDRVLMMMLGIERIGDTVMFPLSRASMAMAMTS